MHGVQLAIDPSHFTKIVDHSPVEKMSGGPGRVAAEDGVEFCFFCG